MHIIFASEKLTYLKISLLASSQKFVPVVWQFLLNISESKLLITVILIIIVILVGKNTVLYNKWHYYLLNQTTQISFFLNYILQSNILLMRYTLLFASFLTLTNYIFKIIFLYYMSCKWKSHLKSIKLQSISEKM